MEILELKFALYRTRGLKCVGCNLGKDYYSDGYRCFRSGLFFHKECTNSSLEICNLHHSQHSLYIKVLAENEEVHGECKLCRGNLPKMYYNCSICDFAIDLICARQKVITKIESPKIHEHCLSLDPKMIMFTCHLCGMPDDRFPYTCKLCDLSFHKDCAESTPEINYSCHPKHPLKCLTRVPSYTDGKCSLCGNMFHILFYHCAICNFSVDVNCANNPPSLTLVHPKCHEHPLTLLPQRIFVCDVCGLDDDPNPYVCLQCNFMIHRNCINIPHIIKVNRHVHRIFYSHCLSSGDWKCGVCLKKINWTCGAYSCSQCPNFAIHMRCATKFGIWDGIELESLYEDTTYVRSYEVIKEGVIKHFSHENHTLKLKEESDANDEYMSCIACNYPTFSSPFYSCMQCDEFALHMKCAYLPKKKIDAFYMIPFTLKSEYSTNFCEAYKNFFTGFSYQNDNNTIKLDVPCGSIFEPFFHESHPLHSLYIDLSADKFCNGCGDKSTMVLSCEVCEFVLDIKCSVLPNMVKHKYDKYHFLSLCYGEETSEEYWCEICEEELNPKKWFYSCDDCAITFHTRCTLGDFIWINSRSEGISNLFGLDFSNRPVCIYCDSRCQFPSVFKISHSALCSQKCLQKKIEIIWK